MKHQIFPIAIVLLASLSCSVTSANIFNEDEGRSLSGLRGRARKHNQKLDKTKSKPKGGKVQAGGKNNPAKKNQGRNKQKQQNKPGKNKPAKKDKPQARPDERIIGGSQATPNAFKFVVSLQDKIGHFCGGSLIARNAVLSAAHCQGTPYDVVLGRHNLNSNQGQTIRAKREVPHPKYRASTTDNDFMLVFLDQPATLNNKVGLVSLNKESNSPKVGNAVTVMGWGDTDIRDEVSTLSDVLMEATVNVISNNQCDASSGVIGGYPENYKGQISQNMLCAKANKQDGCQGDSGGPLVEGNTQVGVVSWGIGCAHRDFPGVYARVSKAYDWIQREVCNDNKRYAEEAGFDCSGASGPSASPPSGGGNYNPAPSPPSGGNSNSWDDDWSGYSGGGSGGGSGNNWDDDWSHYSGGGGGGNSNWDDDWSSYSGGGSGGGNGNSWDDDWSNYSGGGGGGNSNIWDDDWSSYLGGGSGGGNGNSWDDNWSNYSGGGGGGNSNSWDDDWSNYSGNGGGSNGNNWDDDWSNYSGGSGGSISNNWDDDWSSYSGGGGGGGNGNNWDDDWSNYSGGGNSNNWDDDWSSYSGGGGGSSNNWDDDWSSYSGGGNSYSGDDDWGDDYHWGD